MRYLHAWDCPFSKCFQIWYIFAQIFKYFALFLPFFWKITRMPLLSRIGPGFILKTALMNPKWYLTGIIWFWLLWHCIILFILITLQGLKIMVVYICYYKELDSFGPRNGTLSRICGMDKLVCICKEN